ncbi:hypothetical protein BASA81_003235 [Batrachochytrium salamandrivorans]|nr:hypothetical protein BASA81_003235 [Batrachochytrium salamandrivorans]
MMGLLIVIALLCAAAGGKADSFGHAEFQYRHLYAVQDLHRVAIVQSTDVGSTVIIVGVQTCQVDEMQALDLDALNARPLEALSVAGTASYVSDVGFQFDGGAANLYMFSINFTSQFPCWMTLHSADTAVYVVDPSEGVSVSAVEELEIAPVLVQTTGVNGQAAAAVLLVCSVPLVLVLVFVSCASSIPSMIDFGFAAMFMQSFGCGALLSVAVLHVYPEVALGLEESNTPQWKGGALVLGSIGIMLLVQIFVGTFLHHDHDLMKTQNEVKASETIEPVSQKQIDHDHSAVVPETWQYGTMRGIFDFKTLPTIVWGLTLGDGVHNLVDGAAIASAFLACGTSSGWIVTAGIVAHEVPQELGDLVMMVVQGATLKQACFFNVVAQFTALVGMGIVMGLGNLDASASALLMSFGLGTFLFIALCNIMPKLVVARTRKQFLAIALGLSISCMAIGLTTMLEEGC